MTPAETFATHRLVVINLLSILPADELMRVRNEHPEVDFGVRMAVTHFDPVLLVKTLMALFAAVLDEHPGLLDDITEIAEQEYAPFRLPDEAEATP